MNKSDVVLLSIVKYANSKRIDGEISLLGVRWKDIISNSQLQAISVLVVDSLQTYLSAHSYCKPFANESIHDKQKCLQWIGQSVAYERLYVKHEQAMADLARLFATQGIRMMVLKGYGLSLDWPKPNHRPVGDLDIYTFGKWREADALVAEQLGIRVDDGHEHHTIFNYKGVLVENHYDFINTKAHRDAPKIEARLKSLAEKNCRKIEVEGTQIYLPSPDFNVIFLMRHMGQHFSGEHLNMRQVLDWGFFIRKHHEEIDWDAALGFLREIGLYTFFNQINGICVDYLGFSEKDFPTIRRNQDLERRILLDILHPEFLASKPQQGLCPVLWFKLKRWWANRWKHRLVYNDGLLITFVTLAWSRLIRIQTLKD